MPAQGQTETLGELYAQAQGGLHTIDIIISYPEGKDELSLDRFIGAYDLVIDDVEEDGNEDS